MRRHLHYRGCLWTPPVQRLLPGWSAGLLGGGSGGGGALAAGLHFVQHYSQTGVASTSATFSAANFGDAAADREILIAVCCECGNTGNQSFSAFTIAGVASTAVVTETHSGEGMIVAIRRATVPSGSSGNVAMTCSATIENVSIGVYSMSGHTSTTPSDTAAGEATSSNALSVGCDLPANGHALAVAGEASGSNGFVWTAGVTAPGDWTVSISTKRHTGGRSTSVGGTLNQTFTIDPTNVVRQCLVVASWAIPP